MKRCGGPRRILRRRADALFVESPETEDELRQIAAAFKGVPLVANMVAGRANADVAGSNLV